MASIINQILDIATALGEADDNFASSFVSSNFVTGRTYVTDARNIIDSKIDDDDVDNAIALLQSIRNCEISAKNSNVVQQIQSLLNNILRNGVVSLDNYFKNQYKFSLRDYFVPGLGGNIAWTKEFRNLWRKSMNSEIRVPVARFVHTGTLWEYVILADDGVDRTPLPSNSSGAAFELRVASDSTSISNQIVFNGALAIAGSVGADAVTVTIPALAAANTRYELSSQGVLSKKHSGFVTPEDPDDVSEITGGVSGNKLEIWIA
jgi:hypothetical protein